MGLPGFAAERISVGSPMLKQTDSKTQTRSPLIEGQDAAACCVPSRQHLAQLSASRMASAGRPHVTTGSLLDMVRLEGKFDMGSESPETFPMDGEGPVREITLSGFYICKYAVTNAQFGEFVHKTGYRTDAARFGWSFVFRNHVQCIPAWGGDAGHAVVGARGWRRLGASGRPREFGGQSAKSSRSSRLLE